MLAGREHAVDVATQVPHSAVRAYVLRERAEADEAATGRGGGRDVTDRHRGGARRGGRLGHIEDLAPSWRGRRRPAGTRAPEEELLALAAAMRDAGGGVFQVVPSGSQGGVESEEGDALVAGVTKDQFRLSREVEMMRRLHRQTGQPVTFTIAENRGLGRDELQRARQVVAESKAAGERVHPQFAPRPIGGIMSLATYHPFMGRPGYLEIADLLVAERAARMADPGLKARILEEEDKPVETADFRLLMHQTFRRFLDDVYVLMGADGVPDYEPDPRTSVAARARAEGRDPLELCCDLVIAEDGAAVLVWLATGYLAGDLT